jgi:thioredoxin 1
MEMRFNYMAASNLIHLTSQNFSEEVIDSPVPVLIDYWAPWCAPCLLVAPMLEGIAEKYKGKLKIGKLDVDEQTSIAAKYRIMSIPTLHLFKDGELVKQVVGAIPANEVEKMISEYI